MTTYAMIVNTDISTSLVVSMESREGEIISREVVKPGCHISPLVYAGVRLVVEEERPSRLVEDPVSGAIVDVVEEDVHPDDLAQNPPRG